jgi:DNA-directed RNA polymerase alpha subunit
MFESHYNPAIALSDSEQQLDLEEILMAFFKQIFSPVFEKEKKEEKKTEDSEVLKLTVEELDLPTRIANALRRGGFGTVKDLTKAARADIAKVKNLGKKSIDTIIEN